MSSIEVEVCSSIEHPQWGELDIIVTCNVYAGHPGKLHGLPENCYPPEPEEVEVIKVVVDGGDHDGKEISWELVSLSKVEDDAVIAAHDKARGDYEAAMEDKAESMKDEGRDRW